MIAMRKYTMNLHPKHPLVVCHTTSYFFQDPANPKHRLRSHTDP